MTRHRLLHGLSGWIVPVLLLLGWEAASRLGTLPGSAMPAPSDVLAAGWRLTLTGELPQNLWVSLLRAAAGFAIGGSLAFALGLLNGFPGSVSG